MQEPIPAPKTGASLNRGGSESVVGTPQAFVEACEARFGRIRFDLAASPGNNKRDLFFTKVDDALSKDWSAVTRQIGWLNPPYNDIGAWARKAHEESKHGAKVIMLVPASIGSNWFRDFIHGKHPTHAVNGRITFVGSKDGYPKDLMLVLFGLQDSFNMFDVWTPPAGSLGTVRKGKKGKVAA